MKSHVLLSCTSDNGKQGHLGLLWKDCQHVVIDKFLCMVAGCVLGTDVCHWTLKKVNMVQRQQDSPISARSITINVLNLISAES